jgi:ribosomal protein S18 acetylase RimI-like enzyme
MTKIVQLKKADASVLADIRHLLKQLSSQIGTATPATLKKMLSRPDIEIWVARDGERIVGMATLIVLHKPYVISSNAEDIVVDEKYRGQGLGKALMNKIVERARVHHAERIEFTSNPSRAYAIAMYQKMGFKKRETNVYRLEF